MSYLTSVLDKSPIRDGGTPEQALRDSLRLAQHAERLGYHRYWFAEHHATPQLASPAPEVLAAWVLAQTARIRVGTGGVMLRHYAPYKVAETFNLLASLAPGRVDLGIGKAPGGLPASTAALAAGRAAVGTFEQQLQDLEGFLAGSLPVDHPHAAAQARPLPQTPPERFLLGASPQSARLAGELGWRFVYAAHFDGDPRSIEAAFNAYRDVSPQAPLLATVAFAATTAEAAAHHLGALRIYKLHLAPGQTVNLPSAEAAAEYARQVGVADYRIEETHPSVLAGDAHHVRRALDDLHQRFGVGEFILDAPVADLDARLTSLELLSPAPRAAVA
ncbi:MsnO8 family LLM class oxidoreductase [Stenotrophomonas rhizophila]|uniref:MsnO8 family LLM class oxidoreductase n=1 Tax=Stenotrophomonas sp. BIGb0135 TaxID=2940620 RepID=UPI0021686898|nr:MsnO8 family LLM class oxidoreductase [Stenotrophomonas sp. BIGb0135]MCS4236036.1 luciferase family oxidoreductase group 1 [Stenotrophomonas sp. BIGb0135]